MKSKRLSTYALTIIGCFVLCGTARPDQVADSVNTSHAADNGAYWGENDVGWLYTPGSSYSLSGVDTEFSIPNSTVVENRTVTVVVYQGNTPSNGGTLLGSFQFNSSLAEGALGGGSFATPIALTAGQQYFVGFENVGAMSSTPNVDDIGVNFTADAGARFLSNLYYDNPGPYGNAACGTADSFSCEDTSRDILGQPILEFFEPSPVSGVPEPGSLLPLGGSVLLLFGWFRRRRFQDRDR